MTSATSAPVSQRSWVRFPFKPEFFQVSSFQPLRLKPGGGGGWQRGLEPSFHDRPSNKGDFCLIG